MAKKEQKSPEKKQKAQERMSAQKKEEAQEQKKRASKKAKRPKRAQEPQEQEGSLPQNILSVGERVLGDKNIYIAQSVYRQIHKFTEGKTENESGGILVGRFVEEFGKKNILIEGFVEAKYCEATPQTLTFTHETWEACDKEIEKKHKGKAIVGWAHTHPDFGIFLSNYDTFIQENFFKEENQIAYVIDPIRGEEGFYFWVDGKIERCPGFYLYDKTGTAITVLRKKDEEVLQEEPAQKGGGIFSGLQTALLVLLSAVVVLLGFQVIGLKEQVELLNLSLVQVAGQAQNGFVTVSQERQAMQERIAALEQALGIASPEPSALPQPSLPAEPQPSLPAEPQPSLPAEPQPSLSAAPSQAARPSASAQPSVSTGAQPSPSKEASDGS